MTRDESRFRTDPNPPISGQQVTITYVGPATEIEYQVDDKDPVKLKPDKNGKIKIDSLPAGRELALSDNLGLPGYLLVRIVEAIK